MGGYARLHTLPIATVAIPVTRLAHAEPPHPDRQLVYLQCYL